MVNTSTISKEQVWEWLQQVTDPEISVLSIHDLGILRDVVVHENGQLEVFITPTYNGCPAMDMIAANIRLALAEHGITQLKITSLLSPAWTTDWMSEEGKQKLKEYGIAAPERRFTIAKDGVECPQCNSTHTRLLSEFGSTACKALYQCNDCKEPFDYFKCH